MTRMRARPNGLARVLMLLGVFLLFAAPAMPSAAAMPRGDCCADMPCHDQSKKAPCPDACVIACQAVVAPAALIVGSAQLASAPITQIISVPPPGRVLAPELPPRPPTPPRLTPWQRPSKLAAPLARPAATAVLAADLSE